MACGYYGENAQLETSEKRPDAYFGQIYTFLVGSVPFQYWYDDVLVAQMIYFVEELRMEWQQKWDDMRLRSGRDYSLRKLNLKALLFSLNLFLIHP